jgi:hypothetical protein
MIGIKVCDKGWTLEEGQGNKREEYNDIVVILQ